MDPIVALQKKIDKLTHNLIFESHFRNYVYHAFEALSMDLVALLASHKSLVTHTNMLLLRLDVVVLTFPYISFPNSNFYMQFDNT